MNGGSPITRQNQLFIAKVNAMEEEGTRANISSQHLLTTGSPLRLFAKAVTCIADRKGLYGSDTNSMFQPPTHTHTKPFRSFEASLGENSGGVTVLRQQHFRMPINQRAIVRHTAQPRTVFPQWILSK